MAKKGSEGKKSKKDLEVKKPTASKRDRATSKERTDALITELKARYPGKVYRGTEYTSPWMLKRLPTGIPGLDIALHGGLPAGGFTMIYGPEGIGKNYIANCVMREQQRIFGEDFSGAVVSTEMLYDKEFAKGCGVAVGYSEEEISSLDRAYFDATTEHLTDEYKAELRKEVGTFLTVPPSTAEESFDIVLDLIASRRFDVIVIDSFGSLLTEEDEEKNMVNNDRVGGPSAVNTRFARKMTSAFAPDSKGRPNLTCVVGINQIRDVMNRANKFSPTTHEGGGWALKHIRWVGVHLTKVGKVSKGERTVGKIVRWSIEKQKAGGHEGGSGEYDFIWDRVGTWRPMEVVRAAVEHGVIEKAGSWFSYKGTKVGQGMDNTSRYLEKNNLVDEVERATLHAAGVHCLYDFRFPEDDDE